MLTLLVKELRNLFKTWDEIVSVDGLKAGKACVDEGTEMEWVGSSLYVMCLEVGLEWGERSVWCLGFWSVADDE